MKHRALWWLAAGTMMACAQVRDLQGGPKDATPPVLLASEPPNSSTGFTGDRIVLHFDERVTLDRVREKLLISPPLAKTPDVVVSGGTDVVITLRSPLAANTTYTFNVGDAIADLSEGNHALGLSYVVATGDHVDSLSVHGRAVDAFSGEAAAGVLVLLHDAADTTTVRTGMPAYFTRSGADGAFQLTHLRAGHYRLTALRDQNADYRYDLPNEDIAFVDSMVQAGIPTPFTLSLFSETPAQQQLMEARVTADRGWRLVLARPGGALALRSLDREGDPLTWRPEWSVARDTVLLWPSDTTLLTEQHFELREDHTVLDTITYRPVAKMPFYVTLSLGVDTLPDRHTLTATRPLVAVDTARISLHRGERVLPQEAVLDSTALRVLRLKDAGNSTDKGELVLLPGAVHDLYGATNDTLHLPIGEASAGLFGELRITLRPDSSHAAPGPAVLQLIDASGKVARELRGTGWPLSVDWHNVLPGAYSLRVIDDRDNNGRWSTGGFEARRQPETTVRYGGQVTVRAGWTVDVAWTVLY